MVGIGPGAGNLCGRTGIRRATVDMQQHGAQRHQALYRRLPFAFDHGQCARQPQQYDPRRTPTSPSWRRSQSRSQSRSSWRRRARWQWRAGRVGALGRKPSKIRWPAHRWIGRDGRRRNERPSVARRRGSMPGNLHRLERPKPFTRYISVGFWRTHAEPRPPPPLFPTDDWATGAGYSCAFIESQAGCDCSGCTCPLDGCDATCFGYDCEY